MPPPCGFRGGLLTLSEAPATLNSMFLPLYEVVRNRRPAYITWAIMLSCVAIYVYFLLSPYPYLFFMQRYGFTPILLSRYPGPLGFFTSHLALTPLTCIFVHGGFFHLFVNLWTLWIVGGSVEESLGRSHYLRLYLLAGITATATQFLSSPYDIRPVVGASGAIFGIIGAYFRLFPQRKIACLLLFWVLELPAFVVLGFLILNQLVGVTDVVAGVAWWAHIGGFVVGFGVADKWQLRQQERVMKRVMRSFGTR